MAIKQDHVKELERITADLGDLVQQMHPGTVKEWDVFDGAVNAHKHLRKLDTDSLRQLELPIKEATPSKLGPREDCPKCGGSGQFVSPEASDGEPRFCECDEIEDAVWPTVKADWEKQLQPAEV